MNRQISDTEISENTHIQTNIINFIKYVPDFTKITDNVQYFISQKSQNIKEENNSTKKKRKFPFMNVSVDEPIDQV